MRFDQLSSTLEARGDLRRRSIRGFTLVLGANGVESVLRLVVTAVLARFLSPAEFGLFMMVAAITAIADQLRDLGLSTATIQRAHITHEQVSNLFWLNALSGFAFAIILAALAPLVSAYFEEPRLTSIMVVLTLSFALGGLSVQHEALLGRRMRLGATSWVRLLAFAASSAIAIYLAVTGLGYWALVWREILRSGFIVIGCWILCPWIPSKPDLNVDVREMIRFGSRLTASQVIGAIASGLDRFLLGRFQGADIVGLYRTSYQLVVAPMSQVMSPLYQVSLPGLSLLQGDPVRYERYFTRIVAVVAMATMPASLFIAVYAEELTSVVLGERWNGAATFIRVFALGGMCQPVFSTIGFVLVSRGNAGALLTLSTAKAIVKCCLMVVGLRWGAVGVALAEVLTTLVMFVPYAAVSFRGSPVRGRRFFGALVGPVWCSTLAGLGLVVAKGMFVSMVPLLSLCVGAATLVLTLGILVAVQSQARAEVRMALSAVTAGNAAD